MIKAAYIILTLASGEPAPEVRIMIHNDDIEGVCMMTAEAIVAQAPSFVTSAECRIEKETEYADAHE